MIAQIAEMVKASLSVGDLEKLLDEKKKAAEPGSAQQASGPSGAQQGQMDHRVTELEEMKDAAKERRSRIVRRPLRLGMQMIWSEVLDDLMGFWW